MFSNIFRHPSAEEGAAGLPEVSQEVRRLGALVEEVFTALKKADKAAVLDRKEQVFEIYRLISVVAEESGGPRIVSDLMAPYWLAFKHPLHEPTRHFGDLREPERAALKALWAEKEQLGYDVRCYVGRMLGFSLGGEEGKELLEEFVSWGLRQQNSTFLSNDGKIQLSAGAFTLSRMHAAGGDFEKAREVAGKAIEVCPIVSRAKAHLAFVTAFLAELEGAEVGVPAKQFAEEKYWDAERLDGAPTLGLPLWKRTLNGALANILACGAVVPNLLEIVNNGYSGSERGGEQNILHWKMAKALALAESAGETGANDVADEIQDYMTASDGLALKDHPHLLLTKALVAHSLGKSREEVKSYVGAISSCKIPNKLAERLGQELLQHLG